MIDLETKLLKNLSMSNEYPLFTVIIPQKNRAEYLVHTLKTCMIQDYPNFEVIVSDDCSDDNSVMVVQYAANKDSRIKLFAHKNHLGMRDNFEFALNQVKPGFVMALGGDDGLLPGCIWRMYDILKNTKKELLTWTPATFDYSNHKDEKNIFSIRRKKKTGYKLVNSESFLNKLSETFLYQIEECPMIYMKGISSTSLINRVKSRTKDNSFYYCPTPDGFSGVVLAGEVEDYVFTNEPLSIAGNTIKSQGANYRRNDNGSRVEANQFFRDNKSRSMHSELASQPYSPLATLMTADYLLTARDLPGWPGKFNSFTFDSLLRASFKFMEKSNFENEVLIRELRILKEIAIQHNLMELFNELIKSTKRKVVREEQIYGFAITKFIRFEGKELGINNIFEAALATSFIYNFYNKFSFKLLLELVFNSYKILLRSRKYKVEYLPSFNE